MQPSENNIPPGELPRPQYEPVPQSKPEVQGTADDETSHSQAIEQAAGVAAPMQMPANIPTAPPPVQTDDGQQATANTPMMADDADLIEKEWVTKAKQIVDQTKTDPYMQTKEMNKMKADYLKKRYAKEIKLPEE